MSRLVRLTGVALTGLVSLLVIFAGSCSKSADSSTTSDADQIRERATRWWDCRIASDFKSQYDLWDPKFKSRVSLDGFVGSQGSNIYLKYDVKDVAVEGDVAFVTVEYVYKIGLRVPNLEHEPQTTTTEQEWVKVDGAWYFYGPEDPFKAARDAAGGRRRAGGANRDETQKTPADSDAQSEPPK